MTSKSADLPYTPGEGQRQCHCGMVSFAAFSWFFVTGLLRIVGRLLGGHMESKISLNRLVPPLKSRVMRLKLSFPLVERRISSGSGAVAIIFAQTLGSQVILLENGVQT